MNRPGSPRTRSGDGSASVVRLDDVAAGYFAGPVWSGLSLQVRAGEFVTVLGGNGAGKTTLLRLLLGQLAPLSGRVEVLGRPARRGNPAIGYLAQRHDVDPGVPIRGVDLVRQGWDGHRWGIGRASRVASEAVARAVAAVDATGFAHAPVGTLSGGQQQRLRLARALVSGPALLLADEPLLSLDLASRRQVVDLLDASRRRTGSAVIVVTHEINPFLPVVDTVAYVAAGRWAVGPPERVLTTDTLSQLHGCRVDVVRVRDRLVIVGDAEEHHHTGAGSAPACLRAGLP